MKTKNSKVRVVPVTIKIVISFTLFILISNFSTNYINLIFNRTELFKLMNQLLIKDLKSMYSYCNNQHAIYQFDNDFESSISSIEQNGRRELKNQKAVLLGVKRDGKILLQASHIAKIDTFNDQTVLNHINTQLDQNQDEGQIHFKFNGEEYFGVYKYNTKWDAFLLRAEELNEFYAESRAIFKNISYIIIAISILMAIIGVLMLRYLLRYIHYITVEIQRMISSQELGIIDLKNASNDDITYLGVAFNSLSSLINNLIHIFQKFTNQDIVNKAYREREVKLEGTSQELTILFSDIKSFTFITETLGNEIINLLNMYYDDAIRKVVKNQGVIGSIIGDAILSVFGVLKSEQNKSHLAVLTAYELQDATEELRNRMSDIKATIEKEQGELTDDEWRVYEAVLLEIGVGIDGGQVFYGTLGSYVRMTNTVIGDNVNAASRLEGLTRVYKIPVICSKFVMNDIKNNVSDHGIEFYEIDTVQVKGKTTGKKVFWPITRELFTEDLKKQMTDFQIGLEQYYNGNWPEANQSFNKCSLPLAEVFKFRTQETCPDNWNGIWQMQTK
ncbi:MAG: adenylate/guanylate cyclase domain-containing protein [Deltaproteobacteria bacterium]|jgi:adenylate cyclase|nr:adenylate/guanylate cyclase domain-containing protein [Deltaproteobacteria bacterium]MBT4527233.1 adenylate/guanylate cyclase domain-containing protein [Deltaproteobacteria bacterium]